MLKYILLFSRDQIIKYSLYLLVLLHIYEQIIRASELLILITNIIKCCQVFFLMISYFVLYNFLLYLLFVLCVFHKGSFKGL